MSTPGNGAVPQRAATPQVERLTQDVLEVSSPEGRPAVITTHHRLGWMLALIVLIVVLPSAVIAYLVAPTLTGVLAGVGIASLMLLAAAPVWGASLLRHKDEVRAERQAIRSLSRRK